MVTLDHFTNMAIAGRKSPTFLACPHEVRSTPDNGQRPDRSACPKSATSGHQATKSPAKDSCEGTCSFGQPRLQERFAKFVRRFKRPDRPGPYWRETPFRR